LCAGPAQGNIGVWSCTDGAAIAPSDADPHQRVVAQAGGVLLRELDVGDAFKHRLEVTHADAGRPGLCWSLDARPVLAALAPDGSRVAVAAPDGTVQVQSIDAPFEPTTVHVGRGEAANALCLSPDGKRLLASFWGTDEIRVWNLEDSEAAPAVWKDSRATLATFTPDGQIVAVVCGKGTVRLHRLDASGAIARTEELGRLRPLRQASVRALAFSSDGRYLFAAHGRSALVWDRRSATPMWQRLVCREAGAMATGLTPSEDGRYLAVEWDPGASPRPGSVEILDFVGR
jgi:WD40 repeat protein